MQVVGLWRYPVKSMQGEALDAAEFGASGIAGDRRYFAGDGRIEDAWVGRYCSVGEVRLEIIKRCERCVMVTRPQPGGLDRRLGVLTHLSRVADSSLGVLAHATRPGTVALGAPLSLD